MVTPTLSDRAPALNQPVSDVETPVLLVDLETMERNIERMVSVAEDHGVNLRSHAKTQKVAEIAHLQDERSNGGGIMCQTLGEAETYARHGIDDIHLVRMAVRRPKLDRLVWLSDRVDHFATTVDGDENVDPLVEAAARRDTTVNVVLEVDCGLRRTGTTPENAPELARKIDDNPRLSFEGILGHDGFIKGQARTAEEYASRWTEVGAVLERAVSEIKAVDIDVNHVKTGSSATAAYAAAHPLVTEINPGRYPFWDVLHLDAVPDVEKRDCAVTVATTVISKPTADRVVVDAGSKCVSTMTDPGPVPKRRDDVRFDRMSSEHGVVDVSAAAEPVEVGDRLEFVVPSVIHAINLHDTLVGVRNGQVEEVWDVQARGKYR